MQEIPKYKKKAKPKKHEKSDHKHNKINCIVEKNFIYGNKSHHWTMLGWYCDICGKVQGERFEWGTNLKEKYPDLEIKEEIME